MTTWDPSCAPSFGNGVKAMMKTKMKTPTYRYKLVTTFNTLQHNIHCNTPTAILQASFNKTILILTDTKSGQFMNDQMTK